jgi:hypothetical protein
MYGDLDLITYVKNRHPYPNHSTKYYKREKKGRQIISYSFLSVAEFMLSVLQMNGRVFEENFGFRRLPIDYPYQKTIL